MAGMTEASAALCDFALETSVDVDVFALSAALRELRQRDEKRPPAVELFGRSGTGEVMVLLRYPAAAESPALRHKLAREAGRLGGALIDPLLLGEPERQRFYAERLGGCEVKVDVGPEVDPAIEAFRARMGLARAGTSMELRLESADAIAAAWARCVAEGSLFVPSRQVPAEGTFLTLKLSAPDAGTLEATACALEPGVNEANEPGFWALLSPTEGLMHFLARRSAQALQGKKLGGDELRRRRSPRFASCLEVVFEGRPELSGLYASNISRGGLFVRSENPPALHLKVRLALELPDGTSARTEAEVVHRVDADEARACGTVAGVGIAFSAEDWEFREQIERFLERLPVRKPRVLVVDDDRFFREVLGEALAGQGVDAQGAGDGIEALQILSRHLFDFDAVVLDLQMPDLDADSLIDRMRAVSNEANLKVIIASGAPPEEIERLEGRGRVSEVIRRGTPLEEIVRRLLATLAT